MAMSRSGVLSAAELDPVAVVELFASPVEVEVEVEDRSEVELLDPAGAVVTADPTPLEKPVEPAPPPQAARPASQEKRARDGRMR